MDNAWDRQEDETPRKYALFNEFLKMGTVRSLKNLHEKLRNINNGYSTPTYKTLQTYSSQCNWFKRAEAYDMHRLEEERKELEELSRERKKKRIEDNITEEDVLHEKAMHILSLPDFDKNISKYAYAVAQLLGAKKNSSDGQRLDFGEPTEHIEQSGSTKHEHEVSVHDEIREYERKFADAVKSKGNGDNNSNSI